MAPMETRDSSRKDGREDFQLDSHNNPPPAYTSRAETRLNVGPGEVKSSSDRFGNEENAQIGHDFEPADAIEKGPSSHLRSFFRRLGGDKAEVEKYRQQKRNLSKHLLDERWGLEGSPTRVLVMRYWKATRMYEHWDELLRHNPVKLAEFMEKGYCEPLRLSWIRNQLLAAPVSDKSVFENLAQERLYYYLNNGVPPDGIRSHLRPLNPERDMAAIVRRGNARNARAHPLDPARLALYGSPHDVFLSSERTKSTDYSPQVDNVVYDSRSRALLELAEGLQNGTDHLETMILIDVSDSMLWDPHTGIRGADGVDREHDQPPNIDLVRNLVHRALYHMTLRARNEHPKQYGIDVVAFSSWAMHHGQLSPELFEKDWHEISPGGGTKIMSGWKTVKTTFFEEQNRRCGHGRYDPKFGWQPTPGMPKLSLLLFLDGEASDMSEFELELLGETWAYVTIALVGMESCPHHHSHAMELERVSLFNPHVGFFDVHGRVCERMVVEDLLKSVYPVDPPAYEEITDPQYDLPDEPLPP